MECLRIDGDIQILKGIVGGAGFLTLAGTEGGTVLRSTDTYHAFRAQLAAFVEWLRTGIAPVPWAETRELMALVIAGIESRKAGGAPVSIPEILAATEAADG